VKEHSTISGRDEGLLAETEKRVKPDAWDNVSVI
jgi:hypothetical protein